jgi:hypothetical protein
MPVRPGNHRPLRGLPRRLHGGPARAAGGVVGLSVYSPPFPELYQYSDDPRDMCNCVSYEEAIDQYRYVVREVARLTKPGRLSCVHCTDLKRGIIYQHDFPGDVIRVHEAAGLHYFCRVTIWKDAWEFARRTRMKTLMHKTIVEDSSCSRLAPADYLLVFKKPGKNAEPITTSAASRSTPASAVPRRTAARVRELQGGPAQERLSQWIYRQYASPGVDGHSPRPAPALRRGQGDPEERHVCPLAARRDRALPVALEQPGDTVLTPFMGVGRSNLARVEVGPIASQLSMESLPPWTSAVRKWER